jgi:hypothetical protein
MLLNIFCEIHDFCKSFEEKWIEQLLSDGKIKRVRTATLSMSEVMTIVVWFHISGYRTFKWYYIHLINDRGEFLAFKLTPGNVDDRKPVPKLCRDIFGKLLGDKGYISQELFEELLHQGVQLITRLRKNMRNKLMSIIDKLLLRKRAVIEVVSDQLKNISHIEHSRHRSVFNFMVNLVAALVAYTHQPKKPSIGLIINSYVPVAL